MSHTDTLPPSEPPITNPGQQSNVPCSTQSEGSEQPHTNGYKTGSNEYGVYRVYKSGRPSYVPPECPIESLADSPNFHHPSEITPPAPTPQKDPNDPSPFPNMSTKLLMEWHYNGTSTKSFSDLNSLVNNVFKSGQFSVDDFDNFDAARTAKLLDEYKPPSIFESPDPRSYLKPEDGWIETSVPIRLPPPERGLYGSEVDAPVYNVPGLFYRKPLEVIKAAFEEPAAKTFHIEPYEEYWQPSPDTPPERIISEVYNSEAFNEDHAKIRSQKDPACNLETVIAPVLIWSDSTHLATFGNASLWPVYIYLGNQSKYTRGKPSSFSAHHTAYIPKVSSDPSYSGLFLVIIYILRSSTMQSRIFIRRLLEYLQVLRFSHTSDENLCRKLWAFFLMISSWTPMFMELSSNFLMESTGAYLFGSISMLQIIQRSTSGRISIYLEYT